MRIIFVRHGHPDYQNDCLTELGHQHAEAAAQRLLHEGISEIYVSTRGRAIQTAEHIAQALQLPAEQCDFMREIGWGSVDDEPLEDNGHPWFVTDRMISRGQSVTQPDWAEQEPFRRNRVVGFVNNVAQGIDLWLDKLGYVREGEFYRVARENADTVVMVSHAGSSSAALAHMFNMTFPFVISSIRPDFTGITVVKLIGKEGALITPQFELVNDNRHIAHLQTEQVISN